MPSPPLVIANCVQVRLLGTAAAQGTVNVLHANKSGGLTITQALANTVGAAIKSAWSTRLGTFVSGSGSLVRVGLRDLSAANQTEFLDTGAPAAGASVGESLPPQLALCITLRTAESGKSARGRVYLSGFTETDNVAGAAASTGLVTACVAFITDVQGALATNGLTLAVASRPALAYVDTRTWTLANGQTQIDTLSRVTAKTGRSLAVTTIQSRNAAWETQRRRNNGRGGTPTIFQEGFQVTVGEPAQANA